MASTFILGEKWLSLDSVRLGRLVAAVGDPQEYFYDPTPSADLVPIVTEHKNIRENDDDNLGESFFQRLTSLVSKAHSKRRSLVSLVDTKCVKQYAVENRARYFADILKLLETRKWIETALKEGEQVYLLVGFVTFSDAAVTELETEFQSMDLSLKAPSLGPISGNLESGSVEGSVGGGAATKSKFVAEGEQIFALQYRKVKICFHHSKELGNTPSGNRWKVITRHRQLRIVDTNDILEADIDESDEHGDVEFDEYEDERYQWTKVEGEGGSFYL